MKTGKVVFAIFVLLALIVLNASTYIIPEGMQAVVTQFGRPVLERTDAGFYFKTPFVQEVHRLEKRLLPWDGDPQKMPTRNKRNIFIDVWARWRITEPMKFYKVVGTVQRGQQRLDELVDSAVRAVVAKNNLIDAVRTTDDPLKYESKELEEDWSSRRERVTTGRRIIEAEIRQLASSGLGEKFGMELVAVHIKRINYVESVRATVYERMKSERMRIASLYESEAEEEKNRILGQTKKELDEIEGDMVKKSQEIEGRAKAAVIAITADAYGRAPEFYQFLRQLEAYRATLGRGTRLILSTDNEFLKQLHHMDVEKK